MKLFLCSLSLLCVSLQGMRAVRVGVRPAPGHKPMRAYYSIGKRPFKVVCKPEMAQQMSIALQSMNDAQRAEAKKLYSHVQFHAIEGTLTTAAASLSTLDPIECSLVLDQVDEDGKTLLIKAAEIAYLKFMNLLLEYDANAGVVDKRGLTALSVNPRRLSPFIVAQLQAKGVDSNKTDIFKRTALHYLAMRPNELYDGEDDLMYEMINGKVAQQLVTEDAMHAKDKYGFTPIDYGVQTGHLEVLKAFIDCGAPRNAILEKASYEIKRDLMAHYVIY